MSGGSAIWAWLSGFFRTLRPIPQDFSGDTTQLGSGEGGDFRAPLGRAVIGGVITSTVLTLLVIPTFYDIITRWRDGLFRRVRRKKEPKLPVE
jgi:hypothetical protein